MHLGIAGAKFFLKDLNAPKQVRRYIPYQYIYIVYLAWYF